MSQRAVERAVGKLVTDEGFRVAFYRDAALASRDAGLELTPAELHALLHVPREALIALAARLDDRICCVHIDTGGLEGPRTPVRSEPPRRSRGGPRMMRAVVLLGLAALAAGCTDSASGRTAGAPEPAPVAVTTVAAIERALPRVLDVSGALMADTHTDVAAEMPGRVTEMLVERGTAVRVGAVLARLDDQDAQNQLREAEAIERQTAERLGIAGGEPFDPHRTPDVRRARLMMERAEADYRRWERLVQDGLVSRSAFEEKQTEFATARAQVEALANQMREVYQALHAQRARVAMARKALADTVIRAPFDGVVAEKHASVGQYVARGTRVATVVRVDPLRVELSIPEGAAAAVKAGQRISFTVQTYPDRRFEGTIAYVGPALRSESRALVAEALVPNRSGTLQPGLFATARVELPAAANAVMVPAAALRNAAGVVSLFVTHGDRAEVRFVQIGAAADGWVEIVRGVRAGERVVSAPSDALGDGARVVDAPGRVSDAPREK